MSTSYKVTFSVEMEVPVLSPHRHLPEADLDLISDAARKDLDFYLKRLEESCNIKVLQVDCDDVKT